MNIKQQSVNAIRILSAEAITKAKSGHPGICMDAAPITYSLYADIMNYSNQNPEWENRDRFLLSAGHGSAMLYSALHLFGFGLTADDMRSFRQFSSRTPGHPEYGHTAGVDCSTGALGQGIATAVGVALAEAHLSAVFNKENYNIVDHYTYVLCGEGCLEEGISYEACSFAGTQKLSKLILFYDCNKISIEGNTDEAFADDITLRFKSQNWQVLEVQDANDLSQITSVVAEAKADTEHPTVIICHTKIGYGTPCEGSKDAHGSPLSEEQLNQTKQFFNWQSQPFEVPQDVLNHCLECAKNRQKAYDEWCEKFRQYTIEYPEDAEKYKHYFSGQLPDFTPLFEKLKTQKPEATRASGGVVINELAKLIPNLLTGSADLSPSTKTDFKGEAYFSPQNRLGRNIHFGIREHSMAAISNGIALHGGLRIICSTFFVFSDYMKGAMRLSAIMKLPVLYVLTHDGIGVGEDGPTHQPIEQLAMLRATPQTNVYRPCDRGETLTAFVSALSSHCPSVFVMSRQNLPQVSKADGGKGAYVISGDNTSAVLVASGSEVDICLKAQAMLLEKGMNVAVVSMYSTQLFDAQPKEYRESVLPQTAKVVCVEASSDNIWYKYASCGKVLKMNTFGASGKPDALYNHFGFTPENICKLITD